MARTKNRVTGVVIRDGKILLIHRFKYGDEYWVFPGGGVEDGETLEEGLRREMLEETGLRLLSFTEIYKSSGPYDDQYIFYDCQLESGQPHLGGPEQEANSPENRFILEWLPFAEIFKLEHIYPKPNELLVKQYYSHN